MNKKIRPELLKIETSSLNILATLVCPVTHTKLKIDFEANELISTAANLAFPIKNNIPIMLTDEARVLTD